MPYQLIARTEQTFTLERADKKYNPDGDPTTISIRQAAQGEHESRSNIFNEIIREIRPDVEADRLIFRYSKPTIDRTEVRLTMSSCNILGLSGKPLFHFSNGKCDMTAEAFRLAWSELPPDVCEEIHEKVLIVNPDWAFGDGGENLGED
jgi:hypothetical protein